MSAVRTLAVLVALGSLGAAGADPAGPVRVHGLDVYVIASPVLSPGSLTGLRVVTRAVTGLVEAHPLPWGQVEVLLADPQRRLVLVDRRSDLLGNLDAGFRVPDWPEGDYEMTVTVRSPIGQAQLHRRVRLQGRGRVWLIRDRACYQPGDAIRLRALVLDKQRLHPMAGAQVRFGLRDGAGQSIASQESACDSNGIAQTALAIPALCLAGSYRVEVSAVQAGAFAPQVAWVPVGSGVAGSAAAAEPSGEPRPTGQSGASLQVLTDKAIYAAGEGLRVLLVVPEGEGACCLDVVKDGQIVATRSTVLREGRADLRLALGPEVFGTLELQGYQIGEDGEVRSAARLVYVQAPGSLELTVARDQPIYQPGQRARVRFQVTDSAGRPQVATLGVIVSAGVSPAPAPFQPEPGWRQAAEAALADVPPLDRPSSWHNPVSKRRQSAEPDRAAIASALAEACPRGICGQRLRGRWAYVSDLVDRLLAAGVLGQDHSRDPFGDRYAVEAIEQLWPELRADRLLGSMEFERLWRLRDAWIGDLARRAGGLSRLHPDSLGKQRRLAFHALVGRWPDQRTRDPAGKTYRWKWLRRRPGFRARDVATAVMAASVRSVFRALSRYGQENERWYRVSLLDPALGAYRLPPDVLSRLFERQLLTQADGLDFWGRPFLLRHRAQQVAGEASDPRLRFYELVSRGPDGRLDTLDDLVYESEQVDCGRQELRRDLGLEVFAATAAGDDRPVPATAAASLVRPAPPEQASSACPETLLFVPALVTDASGQAEILVPLPTSAGRVRLAAWAHGPDGSLGSIGHSLQVQPP